MLTSTYPASEACFLHTSFSLTGTSSSMAALLSGMPWTLHCGVSLWVAFWGVFFVLVDHTVMWLDFNSELLPCAVSDQVSQFLTCGFSIGTAQFPQGPTKTLNRVYTWTFGVSFSTRLNSFHFLVLIAFQCLCVVDLIFCPYFIWTNNNNSPLVFLSIFHSRSISVYLVRVYFKEAWNGNIPC